MEKTGAGAIGRWYSHFGSPTRNNQSQKLAGLLDVMRPGSDRPLILCVDDAEVALVVRKMIFQHAGYEVVTANCGEIALDIFDSEPVDIVLADHFLSGRTGTEIAREMKQRRPEIPILIVSAAAERPAGLEVVDGFVPKGEAPESLLGIIAGLLKKTHCGSA